MFLRIKAENCSEEEVKNIFEKYFSKYKDHLEKELKKFSEKVKKELDDFEKIYKRYNKEIPEGHFSMFLLKHYYSTFNFSFEKIKEFLNSSEIVKMIFSELKNIEKEIHGFKYMKINTKEALLFYSKSIKMLAEYLEDEIPYMMLYECKKRKYVTNTPFDIVDGLKKFAEVLKIYAEKAL